MAEATASQSAYGSRGRAATQPSQIPPKGWRDILLRVKGEVSQDNVSIVSAGVAFYALLAIFPALAALVSIYGLWADPSQVQQQLATVNTLLPGQAQGILNSQLGKVTEHANTALSLGAIGGVLLALWSATKGTKALITALNIVYDEEEKRSFLKLNAVALGLTLGAILFAVIGSALIVALPALLGYFGLQEHARLWIAGLRWPLLALAVIVALAVLYRYGPSRDEPRWHWVSWGAIAATVLWLLGSALFSFYVSHFGSYNETYGSLGAVIILLMWFYLTAFVVLLGAELNAEMEHQTGEDTTEGEPQPMGKRDAYVADTVGKTPGEAEGPESSSNNTMASSEKEHKPRNRNASQAEPEAEPVTKQQRAKAAGASPPHEEHEGRYEHAVKAQNSIASAEPIASRYDDDRKRTMRRQLKGPLAERIDNIATDQQEIVVQFLLQTMEYFREGKSASAANLKRKIQQHPLPAILVGAGAVWLVMSHCKATRMGRAPLKKD